MSTLNIDEATRKSKFADYKDGETIEVSFTGKLNGLKVDVDDSTLECEAVEYEEEKQEDGVKPPAAVTAAMSKKGGGYKKKMPPGMEGTMGEEAE